MNVIKNLIKTAKTKSFDIKFAIYGNDDKDFFSAIENNDLILVKKLISQGANIEMKNHFYDNVLHYACKLPTTHILEYLLEKNSNTEFLNAINLNHETPLLMACKRLNVEAVKILLNQPHMQINAVTSYMHSALSIMSDVCGLQIIDGLFLSPDGVQLTTMEKKQKITSDSLKIIKLLSEKNVSLNSTDSQGNTALMNYVFNDKNEQAILLVKQGCDIWKKNINKQTIFDIAMLRGNLDLLDSILECPQIEKDKLMDHFFHMKKNTTNIAFNSQLKTTDKINILDMAIAKGHRGILSQFMQWSISHPEKNIIEGIKEKLHLSNFSKEISCLVFEFELEQQLNQKTPVSKRHKI